MNTPKTIWIKTAKTKQTPTLLFFLVKVHYSIEKRKRVLPESKALLFALYNNILQFPIPMIVKLILYM
jgi:hypothetical protein